MAKQSEGYTLVEMLLVLIIMFSMTSLLIVNKIEVKTFHESQILYPQSEAMRHQRRKTLNNKIHFNHNGNINQATTAEVQGKRLKFQLGFGRFYE